jgi:hypothetical protein
MSAGALAVGRAEAGQKCGHRKLPAEILRLVNLSKLPRSYTEIYKAVNVVAYPRLTTHRRRLSADLISTEI